MSSLLFNFPIFVFLFPVSQTFLEQIALVIFGVLSGVLLPPFLQEHILCRLLPPLNIYFPEEKPFHKGFHNFRLDLRQDFKGHLEFPIVLVNRGPKPLVISNVDLWVKPIALSGSGSVEWVKAIGRKQDKDKLKSFIERQKQFFTSHRKLKRRSYSTPFQTYGGALFGLFPIVLKQNEYAELVLYLEPEIVTSAMPKSIAIELSALIEYELSAVPVRAPLIKLGQFRWKNKI